MAPQRKLTFKKTREKPLYQCPECDKILTDNSSYHLHLQLHSESYPFSCGLCSYKCKIKKYLSRHVKKVHNKANGPECKVCGKVFHFDSNLKNHMRVHTGEKPYKCLVCKKAFSSNYCLSMHKRIHTNEKPYQCTFCDYACRDNSTLRRHEERHMGILKNYPCTICKKVFKTNTTKKLHIDEVHYGLDTRRFPCGKCEKGFKTKASLKTHVKTVHDKAYRTECEICGRNISKNNVGTHLQSHVDIRPYKCSFKSCSKSFKDRSTLKKHTLIHYPEYHYQCDMCDSKFPRKSRLRDHRLRHVTEGGFTCDYCGVSFSRKSYVNYHIRTKHGSKCEKFICDVCGLVSYTKKCIILHLRYGHGTDNDRKCAICGAVVDSSNVLKEHYFSLHGVKFVIQKQNHVGIRIKDEPLEVFAEFDFNYAVEKVEMDEHLSDREYEDESTTLVYSTRVLDEDITRSATEAPPENAFDKFFSEQVRNRTQENNPEYVDVETTLAYSEKVLEEDISRNILDSQKNEEPENSFDQFFLQQIMDKPKTKAPPEKIFRKADKRELASVKKSVKKMLRKSRSRKELESLEKTRQLYNKRIELANKNTGKKESTKITYFKKSENVQDRINLENDKNDSQMIDQHDLSNNKKQNVNSANEITQNDMNDNSLNDKCVSDVIDNDNPDIYPNDNPDIYPNDNHDSDVSNGKTIREIVQNDSTEDGTMYDAPISQRITRNTRNGLRKRGRCRKSSDENDSDYVCSDIEHTDKNKNGKIKFDGHECYICFKLFKTKADLKVHCGEHFDICNEKMLKKCPFCGYVTNLNIKRHVEIVHKINISYAYGRFKEKPSNRHNGSKYVLELNNDRELEIIPSVSNLNKMACMRNDKKNRLNKNLFIGTTKLVKRGGEWVVEKQAVNLSNTYLLPEFTEEEYLKVEVEGDTYLDRIKKLSHLAKKRGLKMLYPCGGCEKICQTMAALKLHNRKHEKNPKRFKPKVWVNRHVEYKMKNRKKLKNQTKEKVMTKKPVRYIPVNKPDETNVTENRFASPQPVRNKHKCDKQLIEFYKSNIKGGDIEFWQFLKIFNKMSRENVNDFDDLENRNDLHFGVHYKAQGLPVTTENTPVISNNHPVLREKEPVRTENVPVASKNSSQTRKKNFTRAIMISKKEYLRREEMKNQLRKKLKENRG